MRFAIFFLLIGYQTLFSQVLEYGLDAKHKGTAPIKSFQIFSARCSGSNYLEQLLKANLSIKHTTLFGHKHFSPWFSHPIDQLAYRPLCHYTFEGNEETLFVVIFRNPYDWVRSLRKKPWHSIQKLRNLPLGKFIRAPWRVQRDKTIEEQGHLVDLNPITGLPFKNVMRLRSAKARNMLQIKDRVANIYFINYEFLRDYPEEIIQEIATIFDLVPKSPFTNITYYKECKRMVYKKSQYPPIQMKDLLYINKHLDAELEEALGYRIIDDPDELNKH